MRISVADFLKRFKSIHKIYVFVDVRFEIRAKIF